MQLNNIKTVNVPSIGKLPLSEKGNTFTPSGKKREHNLELINRLDEIRALGYPVLLGSSRKSFIGFTLDLPADQRVEGTAGRHRLPPVHPDRDDVGAGTAQLIEKLGKRVPLIGGAVQLNGDPHAGDATLEQIAQHLAGRLGIG